MWGGGGGVRGCEQRIEGIVQFIYIKGGSGCANQELQVLYNLKKKKNGGRDQELNVLYKRGGGEGSHICLYCTTELPAIAQRRAKGISCVCQTPAAFVCLFGLRLYVPVNNFSVMLGWGHRFLGFTSTFLGGNFFQTLKGI